MAEAPPISLDGLRAGCSFAALPRGFYARVDPRPLRAPRLLHANPDAAALLGLDADALRSPEFLALCSGAGRLADMTPLATAYSGHQFGVWAGQLGDGRAHLLGDVRTPEGVWEIQLKGSGRTPFSRMGDGWAVLRSSVREYLASEAMAGLGIPTTRALALVASDDPVVRETVETAAVVTRLAPSFVRFGHFEHWGHSHHEQKALLDYVVDHWYPECRETSGGETDAPATACRLLTEVTRRTARLIAQWQLAGFCHGVMNTDNMSILGLTLDYGPYGFMDAFQANHICNHSDTAGRYAWNAQPAVARWNLYRLAGSLLVLGCEASALESCLAPFEAEFLAAYRDGLARKLGLDAWRPDDAALEDDWWSLLHAQRADFTLAFRRLADADRDAGPWLDLFPDPAPARAWLDRYLARRAGQGGDADARRAAMSRANPVYVLRNHLAQRAIEAAQRGDASEIDRLLTLLRDPYAERPGSDFYARPPAADEPAVPVSCSS
ncbi:YdiU family protein [Castellaniella denitrificans]|uniref:Protein nucleotidyltransferase YdiU n=1 Tax=Castellaniella denitrificans TaxID=56119 RepID=A0ABT4M6J5_9BURK|nr:YdiU family protein [Castellaniella denitrificans]MCZ4330948.1 YdiU family protein [Castellaniella denitrificans]